MRDCCPVGCIACSLPLSPPFPLLSSCPPYFPPFLRPLQGLTMMLHAPLLPPLSLPACLPAFLPPSLSELFRVSSGYHLGVAAAFPIT